MTQAIDIDLEKLSEYRLQLEKATMARKSMEKSLEEDPQYIAYKDAEKYAAIQVDQMAARIKEKVMINYQGTGEKHPHEKIEVKIFRTFKVIDPSVVREWVLKNLPAALSPDMRKVEKYAMEIGDVDGTEKGEEARVQIASKL